MSDIVFYETQCTCMSVIIQSCVLVNPIIRLYFLWYLDSWPSLIMRFSVRLQVDIKSEWHCSMRPLMFHVYRPVPCPIGIQLSSNETRRGLWSDRIDVHAARPTSLVSRNRINLAAVRLAYVRSRVHLVRLALKSLLTSSTDTFKIAKVSKRFCCNNLFDSIQM